MLAYIPYMDPMGMCLVFFSSFLSPFPCFFHESILNFIGLVEVFFQGTFVEESHGFLLWFLSSNAGGSYGFFVNFPKNHQ